MVENSRLVRWLPLVMTLLAVLGAWFGLVVLPGPPGSRAVPIALGLAAQLAATAVVSRFRTSPHLAMAAVTVVATSLLLLDSPWRPLLIAQGVPWVPVSLTWATVLTVEHARTPGQLRIAAAFAFGYPLAAVVHTVLDGAGPSVLNLLANTATPILGGVAVSLAARLQRARRDRVAALARDRAEVARRAREQERQRVATEIHDSLGHVLTLLVLHANALTVTTTEAPARAAAERMSRLGTEGLAELRKLLDLLSPPEPATPTPHTLVAEARAAGQDVRLDLTGDLDRLPLALARTVDQVVREGLTNTRRHAPGAPTQVRITVGDTVDVLVRNGPGGADPGPGSGRGLAGLSRSVAVLGGTCEHESTSDGGYALRVSLPVGGAAKRDERDLTGTVDQQ
ncbi:histidine kinase [Crossiella sp. CA-258035]|uniref:sensor histidine kinase n=1 Tax=Crossiella sp. CA-258035 TaxID=2981138 RepID=UPI0024BD21AE|nr:histidine kinase [Crossiella sp. CA-258035]WHT22963.1 histidine kinase [Crossiella sp. CA-258035]